MAQNKEVTKALAAARLRREKLAEDARAKGEPGSGKSAPAQKAQQAAFELHKRVKELTEENLEMAQQLQDWGQLYLAVTMRNFSAAFREEAKIPDLWPNPWHQDAAALALHVHKLYQELDALKQGEGSPATAGLPGQAL